MRKRILSIITIIAITLGTCTVALADEQNPNATRNALKSYGSVIYSDGANNSVEIYSDDLYALADQLDIFKVCITDQLAALNTYFSSDGKGIDLVSTSNLSIVHTQPATATVDPLNLNFDTLLEGIAASQSIPTDISEYGYTNGTNLYKTTSGLLTVDGSQSNVEQINISAANAENLSAGSAAWVDGKLILGTGTDNQAYYNKGYAQGYIDGVHYTTAQANISYVYHKHSGNASSGNGCYTKPIYITHHHTHPGRPSGCYGYPRGPKYGCQSGTHGSDGVCNKCGCKGGGAGTKCWHTGYTKKCTLPSGNNIFMGYELGCEKTERTIESATISFK